MNTEIEHWDKKWGEMNERNMRKVIESRGYSVVKYVYPPGTYFPDHEHAFDKMDTVLKGKFKIEALGKRFVLKAGDMLYVPAGLIHNAEVLGDEDVVSLDASKVD
ncbi:MAG: cupin domain-containing protein [Thaumarchaeota archaeon]|nr:cupin domain-containing protein [Nitrososphaerota archaeon]